MSRPTTTFAPGLLACSLLAVLLSAGAPAAAETIDFDSSRWSLRGGKVAEHLGRKSLMGGADLKDVAFENGTIEVDIAVDGRRCFPGVAFRVQNEQNMEMFYLRPHKPKAPDVLQYSPIFNTLSSWQLYSGRGFTAPADVPYDRWIHVKIEVSGTRARVYFDGAATPSLAVEDLQQRASRGYVGLRAPAGGQAWFSNFSVTPAASIDMGPAPLRAAAPGAIASWQISQPYKSSGIDRSRPPSAQKIPEPKWRDVTAAPSGLVDIARYVTKAGPTPECVLARTTIESDREEVMKLTFGYSDEIDVFLNGAPLFNGDSAFTKRDPEFNGIAGLNDALYLNLKKGSNELLLMVTETFGGWGFLTRLSPPGGPVVLSQGVAKKWEISTGLAMPESAAYDGKRDVIYVSNTNGAAPPGTKQGFIARVTPGGEIREAAWVPGLESPTGIAVRGDRLYVVERSGVAVIDVEAGKVESRQACPADGLLNDVAVDDSGAAYISDTRKNAIFRLSGGACEAWVSGWPLDGPNGLLVEDGRLVVGNMRGGQLLLYDLALRKLTGIIELPPGYIDGLASDGGGGWIVSHYEGRVLRVAPSGGYEVLADSTAGAIACADLGYAPGRRLAVCPTYEGDGLVAYQIVAGAPRR